MNDCISLSFHKLVDYKHITNPFRSDSLLSLSTRQRITSVALASIGAFGAASVAFGAISACGIGILTNHVFTAVFKGYNLSFCPIRCREAVLSLEYASILTQENFDAAKGHENPSKLANALR